MNTNDPATPSRRLWLLLPSVAIALATGVIPCVGLLSQKASTAYAIGSGLALCLGVPWLWHVLAELRSKSGPGEPARGRLSLRILAVSAIVFVASLCQLGTGGVYRSYSTLFGFFPSFAEKKAEPAPPAPPAPAAPSPSDTRRGLDGFIPSDATLAVGLSGASTIRQLLAAQGLDTQEKLHAFATCKIDIENAQILLAKRADGLQSIVVRAQGIGDERNLFCLVGVVGHDRMQIRAEGDPPARTFHVQGLLPKPLAFRLLDATTLGATDDDWLPTADRKLILDGPNAQGLLAIPMRRIDRKAPLWSVGLVESAAGRWDLAIDARLENKRYRVRGSSVPPWGEADRAEFELRAPLSFATALPDGVLSVGIRGVLSAIAAAGQAMTASPSLLAPATDAGAP